MKNKRVQILWRYGIVSVMIIFLAILIIGSAIKTTIIQAEHWNDKADSTMRNVYYIQPVRGDILACDGTVLATNMTAYTICLDYRAAAKRQNQFIAALDSLCDSLAHYYPSRTHAQWRQHLAKPLTKEPEKRTTYHVLLKEATYDDYLRIKQFPFFNKFRSKYKSGLYWTSHERRVMPYGTMAQRSIGRCNFRQVLLTDSANGPKQDVLHGYSGLEAALDEQLFGVRGTSKMVQLTRGVRKWVDTPPENGKTLKTTIDIHMQDLVENELQSMLQTTEAEWGTCILMEVETGDIKAISNLDRDKDGKYIEAMNYALRGYEPGSVMKPISMLIALEDGYAYPLDREYTIGRSWPYAGGSPIHDTHSPATLPVRRFIEYSSNIGMAKLITPRYENDLNGFRERLRQTGFFDTLHTGMQGERPPEFRTLDPKAGGRVELSRMAYGYATKIPPLYTCAMYNAIANGGKFVRPRMIKEIIGSNGNVQVMPVTYVRERICSEENARVLREMICQVVYGEGGTAKSLRSDIVKIAGKTGTSRIAYENRKDSTQSGQKKVGYKEGQYRLAFCGFFPYDKPKYTCMVMISNPRPEYKGAATTSGTVVKNVALKMFARGMLDNLTELPNNDTVRSVPVAYASTDRLVAKVQKATGNSNVSNFKRPKDVQPGLTPDVIGLGTREAIRRLETAGYNVNIRGTGYANRQQPEAGTPLKAGKTVTVTFTTN